MRSLLFSAAPSALFGLCALAAPAVAADNVEIRLVDGNERPVTGLDVFVFGPDGASLTAALGAGESIFADNAGSMLTVELPMLRSSIDVDLPERGDAVVTLTVDRQKGLTGVPSVKATDRTPPILFSGPGPANDDCANAIALPLGDTAFTTIGATTDNTIGSNENDIWYTFTAPGTGVVSISTCDQADYDTDLLILDATSTCGAQVELARNDDDFSCSGNTSILNAGVSAGSTYLVSVGGFDAAAVGSGTLTVSFAGAPSNDDCANAQTIAVGSSTTFDNSSATSDPSEPDYSCIFSGPGPGTGTLWFDFVATTENVLLDTLSSTGSTDTVIAVYDGGCGALTEIACNDDHDLANAEFLSSLAVGGLTVGNTYLIQIGTFSAASQGSITLDLEEGVVNSYNGTGVNTATLTVDAPAVIGGDLNFEVGPGPAGSLLYIARNAFGPLPLPPFGELLIDPTALTISLTSGSGAHTVGVPDDAAFVGLDFFAQGVDLATLGGTNGLELVIATF